MSDDPSKPGYVSKPLNWTLRGMIALLLTILALIFTAISAFQSDPLPDPPKVYPAQTTP